MKNLIINLLENIKTEYMARGLSEKNKALFLVINIKESTYASLQVSQQQIENLLRGKITFWKLIYQTDKLEIIKEESSSNKTPSKAYLTISTLYMETMNRIFSVPNLYYYWNEFQYSLRR